MTLGAHSLWSLPLSRSIMHPFSVPHHTITIPYTYIHIRTYTYLYTYIHTYTLTMTNYLYDTRVYIQRYSEFITFPIKLYKKTMETVEVEEEDDETDTDMPKVDEDGIEVTEDSEEKADSEVKTEQIETWDWHRVNNNMAIWSRDQADITDDEYRNFYKSISKTSAPGTDARYVYVCVCVYCVYMYTHHCIIPYLPYNIILTTTYLLFYLHVYSHIYIHMYTYIHTYSCIY